MSKRKLVVIVIVSVIVVVSILLAFQVYHYSNLLNEPRLNLTKVQEHLDKGGSLDDPITPNMYESQKIK